jgi:hypothetical protein
VTAGAIPRFVPPLAAPEPPIVPETWVEGLAAGVAHRQAPAEIEVRRARCPAVVDHHGDARAIEAVDLLDDVDAGDRAEELTESMSGSAGSTDWTTSSSAKSRRGRPFADQPGP